MKIGHNEYSEIVVTGEAGEVLAVISDSEIIEWKGVHVLLGGKDTSLDAKEIRIRGLTPMVRRDERQDMRLIDTKALQEREERRKGCKYCLEEKRFIVRKPSEKWKHDEVGFEGYIGVEGNINVDYIPDLDCHYGYGEARIPIDFCPFCGRKLKVEV